MMDRDTRPIASGPPGRQAGRPWRGRLLTSLVAGLIAALLLAAAYAPAWPLTVDVGQRDARFALGFHEPERFGDTLFRWTTGRSELALPRPAAGPHVLSLRLLNGYPEGQPDPRLALRADGRELGSFDVTRRTSGVRRYMLLLPTAERADWATRLELESSTYTPPGDPRPLGVVVDWAQIAPTLRASPLPPLWPLLWSFALGLLAAAALALLGAGRLASVGAALLLAGLVALGVLLRPAEVLPFVQRLVAIPAIACLWLVLVRLLAPVQSISLAQPGTGRPARAQVAGAPGGPGTGALSIRGEHLPLLLGLAWWMLPVFQAVQIWDGASIGVGSETFILGGIAAALLVAGAIAGLVRGRALAPGERRELVARYALIGLALGATIHLSYALAYAFTRNGKDFWILFKGARDWARGGSLYDMQAVMTNHVGAVFKVPPFYGMLFTPFVFQDGLQILHYHRLINVGLMIATALVWLRMWRIRPLWWAVAGLVILLNTRPLADTIAFGQIDLMLLFLLTCALWAMRAAAQGPRPAAQPARPGGIDRSALLDLLAGALVALGTLFKIYPVILLAFFVLKGRWWALAGFALGMLVSNGIAVAVMGWEMHRVYLFEVVPNIGGTTSWVENQTVSGFLARLVDVPFDAHLFGNRAVGLAATAISGLLSLLACWLTLRPARGDSTLFALQYAQFLLLMVLAVPAAWMHYETLLALVFAALLLHLRDRAVSLPRAAALALSFALIGYGNQWSFNGTTVMGVLTVLGISYKFYGMLLLGGLLVSVLTEERAAIRLPALPWLGARRGDIIGEGTP